MVSYSLLRTFADKFSFIKGDASDGLTKNRWLELHEDGIIKNDEEVYRLVYYGGVQHDIRKDVWPYLLGHYQ